MKKTLKSLAIPLAFGTIFPAYSMSAARPVAKVTLVTIGAGLTGYTVQRNNLAQPVKPVTKPIIREVARTHSGQ